MPKRFCATRWRHLNLDVLKRSIFSVSCKPAALSAMFASRPRKGARSLCVLAVIGLFASLSLHATVTLSGFTSSVPSPQPLGTSITFTATATDTGPGPLAFQFNVAFGSGAFAPVRNYNIGTATGSTWVSQPFSWTSIVSNGAYSIQVIAEDFATGETATETIPFNLKAVLSSSALQVVSTGNPLVALVAVPACPTGSSSRIFFDRPGSNSFTYTPFQACKALGANNFYIGGMHAGSSYTVGYQIETGSNIANGKTTTTFTTGQLPSTISFPTESTLVAPTTQADTAEKVLLHSFILSGHGTTNLQPAATDLSGNFNWFYNGGSDRFVLLTRPLAGGQFLLFQSGTLWVYGGTKENQTLRRVDLAGNILNETNIGYLQQQFIQMGATDLQPCSNIVLPAAVGSACMTAFSHDFILLPNGNYAAIASMEKIFPPGTQGDTSGLNVDILGDAILVLDPNFNPLWYFDSFQHDGGGTQLDINRPPTLGESCGVGQFGCPVLILAGTPGVTSFASDWMHSNSIQYRASDGNIILSSRHQDWVMLIDYENGAGSGNLLWRMGVGGDFTFNNINNDPYPWFSHQHDAGFETTGVFDCFDNGNTRIVQTGSGNSRGIALTVDEPGLTVTPVFSQDLGYFGYALGSAQLLSNGNYHFQPSYVLPKQWSYSLEYVPVAGATTGTEVYNLESQAPSYRSFRMTDLYTPPFN